MTMDQELVLQFGDFGLQSAEGAQQGGPLGPLYFCLSINKLQGLGMPKLARGFFDDVAIGGDAACVMEDFMQLEAADKHLGLEMNRDKC